MPGMNNGSGDKTRVRLEPLNPYLYNFVGMICYQGRHYVSIIAGEGQDDWVLFDDQKVRKRHPEPEHT